MTNTWSLVTTMLGVPETILPCIAHHLQSDAVRLHIYLDAPLPRIEAALAGHPRCVVTVCDGAHWARRPGGRPDGVVRRQMANVEHARQNSDSDWLVHVDSDEFLVATDPAQPLVLGAELARVPAGHDWVRIAPLERVMPPTPEPQSIFDGMFRAASTDAALIAAAYGRGAQYLQRGLSGHSRGKIGFRRKTRLRVRLHDVIKPPPRWITAPVVTPAEELPPLPIWRRCACCISKAGARCTGPPNWCALPRKAGSRGITRAAAPPCASWPITRRPRRGAACSIWCSA